ncbi:MAG: hypothetical protein K9J06_10460 [Flavobacteriales bacterium]|nr:hypothetical protein [Flavobacteriales bacterium]
MDELAFRMGSSIIAAVLGWLSYGFAHKAIMNFGFIQGFKAKNSVIAFIVFWILGMLSANPDSNSPSLKIYYMIVLCALGISGIVLIISIFFRKKNAKEAAHQSNTSES